MNPDSVSRVLPSCYILPAKYDAPPATGGRRAALGTLAMTNEDAFLRAIARLGASRDGLIRRHRRRPDGTWRDSVLFAMTADDWPAAATRLRERLAAPSVA